jgi:hypothetical protein
LKKNPERFISPKANTEFDVTRAKIIIGDFLSRFEEPCTATELREILTVNENVIGYFTYVDAYDQMLDNKMISVGENGIVRLTETGRELLPELLELSSEKLRDRALASAESYFCEKKTRRDTDVRLIEKDGSYAAVCECFDNGTVLMLITLWYPDMEKADFIRSLMNADPVGIYCSVFDRLLRKTLDLVELSPQSAIDENMLDAVQSYASNQPESENRCESKALDKGFEVDCKCFGDETLLMELDVFAPDEQQAGFICQKLTQDKLIYSVVTRLVLQNLSKNEM